MAKIHVSTTINGSLRATGQISNQGGNIAGALSGLLGDNLGRNVGQLTNRVLDQRADIRGNVSVLSRPALQPNWRIEPNLSGSVSIGDGGMSVAGIKLNVSDQVKPLLDKTVNEQIGTLSDKLRNDRTLEITRTRAEQSAMAAGLPAPTEPMFKILLKHQSETMSNVATVGSK